MNEKEAYDKVLAVNDSGYKKGYRQGVEDSAKVVRGEIQVYEDQAKVVNPTRLKKIQRRWHKLKDIENRILKLGFRPEKV